MKTTLALAAAVLLSAATSVSAAENGGRGKRPRPPRDVPADKSATPSAELQPAKLQLSTGLQTATLGPRLDTTEWRRTFPDKKPAAR